MDDSHENFARNFASKLARFRVCAVEAYRNSGNSQIRDGGKEQKRISDFYRRFCDWNENVAKSRPRLRQPTVRTADIASSFSIVIPRNFEDY